DPEDLFDRIGQRPGQDLRRGRRAVVEVPGQQLGEDRVLVREVLVQRADRDAGALGDAVGGAGGVAVAGENVSSRGQDPLPGQLGTHLPRLFTWLDAALVRR